MFTGIRLLNKIFTFQTIIISSIGRRTEKIFTCLFESTKETLEVVLHPIVMILHDTTIGTPFI
jgi:hypothetical protein